MGTKESEWLRDPGVQAVIEVIARKVTEAVIAEHIRSCPHGQKLAVRCAWLIGLCCGCGLLGGVTGGCGVLMLARALMGLP